MIRLKVKEIAQSRGISQNKLARMADVDNKTMSKAFRSPHHYISTEVLDKIALALQVDISCLLENDPPLPKT